MYNMNPYMVDYYKVMAESYLFKSIAAIFFIMLVVLIALSGDNDK